MMVIKNNSITTTTANKTDTIIIDIFIIILLSVLLSLLELLLFLLLATASLVPYSSKTATDRLSQVDRWSQTSRHRTEPRLPLVTPMDVRGIFSNTELPPGRRVNEVLLAWPIN